MSIDLTKLNDQQRERQKRVRIRQIGGDDGAQWCLLVDGGVRMNGMTRSEAVHRRDCYIRDGLLHPSFTDRRTE